jgi:hypothetical protein
MRWPFSRSLAADEPPGPRSPFMAHPVIEGGVPAPGFVCTTCGRSDLPEAGGWDPPVCTECDAAINFDEERLEAGWDE